MVKFKNISIKSPLAQGQVIGLLMMIVAIPISIIGLIVWSSSLITAGIIFMFFGVILRVYGTWGDVVVRHLRWRDQNLLERIARIFYIIFVIGCVIYVLLRFILKF
jgi:hypothetical protein